MTDVEGPDITATDIKAREKERSEGPLPGDSLLGYMLGKTLEAMKKVGLK